MTDTIRIKRRPAGGAAGAPSTLAAAELAYNEQDDKLYYGKGNSGGNATSIIPIAGPGLVSGGGVTISDTPPATPANGSLWWESDTGKLFVSYFDGTSTQWINTSPAFGIDNTRVLLATIVTGTQTQIDTPAGLFTATYDSYEIEFMGLQHAGSTPSVNFRARISTDNGATYDAAASAYYGVANYAYSSGSPWGGFAGTTSGDNALTVGLECAGTGYAPVANMFGRMRVVLPASSTQIKNFDFKANGFGGPLSMNVWTGAGIYSSNTLPITNLRFFWTDGTAFLAGGIFKIYGMK